MKIVIASGAWIALEANTSTVTGRQFASPLTNELATINQQQPSAPLQRLLATYHIQLDAWNNRSDPQFSKHVKERAEVSPARRAFSWLRVWRTVSTPQMYIALPYNADRALELAHSLPHSAFPWSAISVHSSATTSQAARFPQLCILGHSLLQS